MGYQLEGEGFEVDGVKFGLWVPTITEEALKAMFEEEPKEEEAPQLSWGELAELTHGKQVELFGYCTCEDGPKVWDDCTQDGEF
jgi:hypothetical protein